MTTTNAVTTVLVDGPVTVRWCGPDNPGHPGEYLLGVEGAAMDNYIHPALSRRIGAELGSEWDASNRGTRVEITHRTRWMHHDHDHIRTAVGRTLASLDTDGIGLLEA